MIKKDFLFIFIIALLVRLAGYFLVYSQPVRFYGNSDSYNYENIAINIIQHHGFSGETESPFTPNLYRTPVYPMLMAGVYSLTGNSVIALILIQILISSFTAALMPVLVYSMNLSPKIGWIAGFVLILDPLIGLTTYLLITETVFISFLIPATLMLVKYFKTKRIAWLISSAILFALTSLTRPVSQLLPLVLVPLFFVIVRNDRWRFALKSTLVFLFISLLLTYSWAYRNYRVANIWTFSAVSVQDLLYKSARDVIAEAEKITKDEAAIKLTQFIRSEVEKHHLSFAEEIYLMRSTALDIFRQHPKTTLMVHVKGFVRVMINPGFNLICKTLDDNEITFDSENNIQGCTAGNSDGFISQTIDIFGQMSLIERLVAVWEIFLLAGIYLGAIVGAWKLLQKKQWKLLYLLLVMIAYFSALSAGGVSVSRYRIPFIPFLAILAAIGATKTVTVSQEKDLLD